MALRHSRSRRWLEVLPHVAGSKLVLSESAIRAAAATGGEIGQERK